MNRKKEIEDILEGRTSVEEAQQYLRHITEDDIKRLIPEEKLAELMDNYREIYGYKAEPIPLISEEKKLARWKRIQSDAETPVSFFHQVFHWFKEIHTTTLSLFSRNVYNKWGMTAAAVIVLMVMIPLATHYNRDPGMEYSGIKGNIYHHASLQYAIVGPEGKLVRPERVLTQEDTLAFRVNAPAKGYCSIFVIHENKTDLVVADKFLTKGIHDLQEGYLLSGNRGLNTLVLTFSRNPVSIRVSKKQRLILESTRNSVSELTIDSNQVFITYQAVDIE